MDYRINGLKNKWINELMDLQMNRLMNEWINE